MAIHVRTYAVPPSVKSESFESIRQTTKACLRSENIVRTLASVQLRCQSGMAEFSAEQCLGCKRFVNCLPSRNRDQITIQCMWCEADPISDVMTLASELISIPSSATIAEANAMTMEHGVRHLLVLSGSNMVGVVCRCDLIGEVAEGETVGHRVKHCPWVVKPRMTVGQTAAIMASKGVGCLPVVVNGNVVGIVTRTDLRRVGVPESMLGAEKCAACNSSRGVRPHPDLECVDFCLDCIEQSQTVVDYDELGCGD